MSEIADRFYGRPSEALSVFAVTGTNGKTTTVSLMAEMVKYEKSNVFIGGNIGIPFCEAILLNKKWDYAILELSSFQLESIIDFSPEVALLLNIFPNHTSATCHTIF